MSGSNIEPPVKQEDINKYEEGWTREMMKYWRERLMKMKVYRTGKLYSSISGHRTQGSPTLIEHRFAYYGIYVALGTGKGYKRGNGGDLKFLEDWKTNNKHRKKRDWFNKKYFASVMRLGEVEAAFYGETYQGLMADALEDIFNGDVTKHFTTKD